MILAQTPAVPSLDPIGLPGYPVVFVALLLLTQFLHLVFMNFVLGGSLIAVGLNIAHLRGHSTAGQMARIFYKMIPVTISMAVTMGVAPLLFVQVLYGPYFYSATVLMGFGWFSFFVAAMVGFYLVYWLIFHGADAGNRLLEAGDRRPGMRLLISLVATTCFLWVGWVMVNNHELSLRPLLWRVSGYGGSRWYTPASTTLPRYLHDLVGATAVAGLWLAGIGWWRTRAGRIAEAGKQAEPGPRAGERGVASTGSAKPADPVNSSLIHLGLKVALLATTAQMATGIFLLLRLTPAVRDSLLGFNTVLGGAWIITLVLIPVLFTLLAYASLRPQAFRWYGLACMTMAVTTVGMLLGREHVRLAHLALPEGGSFKVAQWSVYPQNVSLIVFAVLLVGGLAIVGLMLRWVLQGTPSTAKG